MKLSIKISIVIGVISIVVSSVVAGLSYFVQLEQVTQRNQVLVTQMANSAAKPSAIAAYLSDIELANEIVAGLAANDLIASASITINNSNEVITQGMPNLATRNIRLPLINPFIADDVIGYIDVYADARFISELASNYSRQNAIFMVGLSVFIALIVGLYVRFKLTSPLKKLSNEVSAIDTHSPDEMQAIEIKYTNRDEISKLTDKTNLLISALKKRFRSERKLFQSTQELQKRFRLLFEQATAGIGLVNQDGVVTIANMACTELFGVDIKDKQLAEFFESPSELRAQLLKLESQADLSQVDIDLAITVNEQKRYLHCLFSSIAEAREQVREDEQEDLSTFVEFIVYDVTDRRKQEMQARYEADHDALTGLMNRRAGQLELGKLLKGLTSNQGFLAIMMIDLNKFKPINDTYGHEAGDLILEHVSAHLSSLNTGGSVVPIRWGGDEFVVGMYISDKPHSEEIARQLLTNIRKEVSFDGSMLQVGASIGILLLNHEQKENWTLDDIIKESDELMYEAKQNKDLDYITKFIGDED